MARAKTDIKRRKAVAEALVVLRRALKQRMETAAERIRVARAYRVLGDSARSATWYRSAVDELSTRGEAVRALAVAKEMTEVMPQEQRAFADLAERFSQTGRDFSLRVAVPLSGVTQPMGQASPEERILDATELLKVYEAESLGASSQSLPSGTPLPSLVPPDVLEELHVRGEIDLFDENGQLVDRPDPVTDPELMEVDDAELEVVEEEADPDEVVHRLQKVPLFSDLDRSAFVELARAVKLRTVGDRCFVFREGEDAGSFFLVAEGSLELVKSTRRRELALRHFHQGEVFGMFGLFAGRRRAASVRAIGNASVLEFPAGALANVVRTHPKAKVALSRFYKDRLLENFLAASPLFEDLDAIARALLIGQFRERKLGRADKVVSPGEVFNGLFLVVTGKLAITKRTGGAQEETLAELSGGQFFGVVSALSGTPCRCSILASEASTLTYLPQKAFNEFVKDHPTLRLLPQRLAQEGLLVDKDVFVGDLGIPGLS